MSEKAQEQEHITNEANEQETLNTENEEGNNPQADENTATYEGGEQDELQKLQAELVEMKDKHLRLVAEFDNFRKRTAKERVDLVMTAGKDVIQSMLDVLDDCDRATKQMENETDVESVKEGAKLVFHKLRSVLQLKGLKVMESKGKEFDPELHEAITEIPAPAEDLKGKIIDEVQPGYYLNDKLIRHAKVVVGN